MLGHGCGELAPGDPAVDLHGGLVGFQVLTHVWMFSILSHVVHKLMESVYVMDKAPRTKQICDLASHGRANSPETSGGGTRAPCPRSVSVGLRGHQSLPAFWA